MRADVYAAAKLGISRNKAAELLKAGELLIAGAPAKCSAEVAAGAECQLLGELYVSRAALKLKYFLNENLTAAIAGARCLDVGSSTGGFTQILLECGAREVVCVDVGSAQLHEKLRTDSRVKVRENTDIKDFSDPELFDVITADVSFTSLARLLPYVAKHARAGGDLLLLFKPQFELGRSAARSKKGVIKDSAAVAKALDEFVKNAARMGLCLVKMAPSEVAGKEGNIEYLFHFKQNINTF